MEQKFQQNNNDKSGAQPLFSPTPAKASGLTFTLATIFPVLLSFVFITVITALGLTAQEGYDSQDWFLYASFLLPQISSCLVAFFYFKYTKTSVFQAVRAQKCRPRYIFVALALQIGLLSLSFLNTLFLEFLGGFGYEDTGISLPNMDGANFVFVFIVVAVLPAILEETVFRGFLQNGLRAFGTWGTVLICGALFSLYHQNPAQTLYQFCCGAAFALVTLRAGSILPTVISHFFNNGLILVMTKWGGTVLEDPFVNLIVMGVSLVCLVGSLVYLLLFDKNDAEKLGTLSVTKEEKRSERKYFLLFAAVGVGICVLSWLATLAMGMTGVAA